ncbi:MULTISPECIES: nucleobase:cation symporter-2 family protein [unclassified Vibrio]|uniref:Nucleobase:cation symporter-2 family protein n=1 Tax=Vibrio sp. HB236076 TaxID=3232307 RepID=A0AB39HF32_9VIBR|nr:nucleobase:cation symporter-2 family protein [Vibrio sp. HB161653]MDP5252818.1 nucleobase:cation symporter-2 family protein [Vibrio sp. HB161653]
MSSDLIYALEDKPKAGAALYAGLQHVLASFVGIITPTLVIGGVLGLAEHLPYLISMALIVSGVGTFIQARRIGPMGSGMICVQGTSFAFLSAVLGAGFIAKQQGGGPDEILALIFGVCFFGAFIEMVLSQFLDKLKNVITPIVTGIVVTTIGISLIKVGMTDLAGGFNAPDFGAWHNVLLGGVVLTTIIILNRSEHLMLRLSSILIGMLVGYVVALSMGIVSFDALNDQPLINVPMPFKYGFDFDWYAFFPIAIIYAITAIESTGDITANCIITKQPVTGPSYFKRIKGGILADGFNSMLAAVFNTFPNTTFSQNNSVIQLTGIASRYVGYFVALLLCVLGLFPMIGAVLTTLPKPVIGGATLVMFGTVAAAGIKIIASEELDRKNLLILAVSFGVGLGVMMVPEVLSSLPKIAQSVLGSPVTSAGITAIVMTLFIGVKERKSNPETEPQTETSQPLTASSVKQS